jgi:integrase
MTSVLFLEKTSMARVYNMTWIPARRGWMKEYRGRKHAISCRQLNAPETKEGSYQAANEWWAKKKAEIDGASLQRQTVQEHLAAAIERIVGSDAINVARMEAENDALRQLVTLMENRKQEAPGQLPQKIAAIADTVAVPDERTVSRHVERWVQTQQARVAAGQMAPDQADNLRIALCHFRDWFGAAAPVDGIDAGKFHDFYLWCLAKDWSNDYKKKVFATARTFIRFLWENDVTPLPKNLDSKGFRFNAGNKVIVTWTPLEFRNMLKASPGQLKLHLLLMANCGMTQQDISDLEDEEVDWQEGRILRKRSKTSDKKSTPTVNYKLWPVTFELLRKYRSGTPTVLLTESGRPFVRKELVQGRLIKSDNIRSNFAHVRNRVKFPKSLKLLRKTSATLLESHETYGRFTQHFLGHAPRTIAARHYAAPAQDLFDAAVDWLGQQYGV